MNRTHRLCSSTFALLSLALLGTAAERASAQTPTVEAKIASAVSAAPAEVAGNAMIMDWPAAEKEEMKQLRAGTNGWMCMPDNPATGGADPMCLDGAWQSWIQSYAARSNQALEIDRLGIAYMLQGDGGASNTDPFATAPTADNAWVVAGPHLMIIVPDPRMLDTMPTDPKSGGPWVMWKGTPYAHMMVPVP
jgi:hypothetical protein